MEKSNKFLKVTGILMIIGGSFALLSSILVLLFGVLLVDGAIHANLTLKQDAAVGLIVTALIFIIAAGVIQFLAGIQGVKNAAKPEKANICIILGSLTALFYIVSQLLNFLGGKIHNYLDIIVVMFGLVVPALYLLGAIQNKMKD